MPTINREKIKYQFIIAVEACIDICQHISARLFAQVPDTYAQCFDVLKENNVITSELAARMSTLAKFRNILVHLYWKVDDERVVRMLPEAAAMTTYVVVVTDFCRLRK